MWNKLLKIQIKDIWILIFLLILIILSTYVWINHHIKVKRVWYWVQYPFINSSVKCSKQAPQFMYELMDLAVDQQKSMANQLVYLSPKGQLYHCESGWEDGFNGQKPITVDSRFIYASVSKPVTSAMVLDLINENKIRLDQKITEIIDIPEPKDSRIKDITVEMLLQHSAGFDRLKTYTPMLTMDKKPWCPTQIEYLSEVELDFDPNTQFQYSNLGYCLLGVIVEKITGLSFREAVEIKYNIAERNIEFINGEFLPNEIEYDYRNENFYGKNWRGKFDFTESLSAVGGLSGSAKAITLLTKEMLRAQPLNILSRSKSPCAITKSEGCYGYALEPYQALGEDLVVYNKSGYFPGVEADLFVDDRGGVITFLRGATTPKRDSLADLRKQVYESLLNYYS